MLLFLWLARLRERWFGKLLGRSHQRHRPATRQRLYRRLELEQLEKRIVPSVTLLGSYQGIDFATSGGYVPPDTQGAAGTTNYVETTNQEITIFNPKNTGASQISDSLSNFLYTQGGLARTDASSELSDPVATWDEQIQRFIIGDQDVDDNTHVSNFDLAVSKSSSPATLTSADWEFFQVKTTENGYDTDYPGNLGWNHDALVFTLNMVNTGSGPDHVEVNSINLNALANGTPLTEGTNAFQKDFSGLSLRPTVMHDSKAGDPMWLVEEGGNNDSLNVVKMTNVLSSSAAFTTTNLAVKPYSQAVPELQPNGTAITTDTDSRIMKTAMQNGLIVAAQTVSNAAGDLDAIQWYVINTTSGTPSLQQQGDISGGAGTYYAYPGIDMNSQDDIGISYAASGIGTGQYMSMYITGRTPTDTTGTMEKPVLVQAGQANVGDGREGDLSGINVDSDGTFWAGNEFATADFGGSWGTDIAHFTLTTVNVSTTANNTTAVYSPNAQTVALSATVTDTSDPSLTVNEGAVTFTVKNGSTTIGSVQGAVSGGTANADFRLPAGQAPGNYTIAVSYTDSSGIFTDSGDANAILAITPANVTTTANNSSAVYSSNSQTVTLSATVADASIPSDTVDEGTVTFTVKNGSTALGSVQGTVSGGKANADFTLPAGQAPGSYIIAVSYGDSSGNFMDVGNTNATLTVTPANVITTANDVSATYSPKAQTVTLSAAIADASIATDTVNQGTVTFTVKNGATLIGSVQGTVSGGKANANFNLPAGQAAGKYTIAVSYKDSQGKFIDSGDINAILTIAPAKATTIANNVSAVYSPNAQTVTLNATIADASIATDTVGEGIVLFTIKNGPSLIASVQGTVSGGKVNADITLPAGLAVGKYTIVVSYSDSQGNFSDGGDTNATLTIVPANVTTTVNNVSTDYSPDAQTLALDAIVTDASISSDTVSEGIVTFLVTNGGTTLGSVQGAVNGGKANANLALPVGLATGNYTIAASYSDSLGNYTASSDPNATLSVAPANVTTTASATGGTFNTSAQNVDLNATVTDTSNPNNVVSEGVVTFTITSGPTVIGSVQVTVSGGTAHITFTLPGGLGAGSYTITVSYSDSQGNFADSGDNYAPLTVGAAATTTQLIQASLTPNLANLTETETLTAHVGSSIPVTQGTVTFILPNQTVWANVDGNGNATALLSVPMLDLLSPQVIAINYADPAHNLTASTDTQTASWPSINPLLPTTATFAPNSQTVTEDVFGWLLTFTNGLLTAIDFGPLQFTFSYNAFGQLTQVTWDGIALPL